MANATQKSTAAAVKVIPLDVTGRAVGEVVSRELKGATPKLVKAALKSNKQVSKTAKASAQAEPKQETKTMATKTKNTKNTKKTAKPAAKKTPKQMNPCLCGCKALVANRFKQGHDARLKGMLLRGEVKAPNAAQKEFAKSHGVKIGANKK